MTGSNPVSSTKPLAAIKPDIYSPLAQSVEHAAVNRGVVGSSPTRGAICDISSVDRTSACHAEGRGFESRMSLQELRV